MVKNNKISSDALELILCSKCLKNYRNLKDRYIEPTYPRDQKEKCFICNYRYGYEYAVWKKKDKE